MTSKNKGIPDFLQNEIGNSPGINNINNILFSDNSRTYTQPQNSNNSKISKEPIANFLPNFILNDISKEKEEEAFNKESTNSGINGQNFFFQDYDDDSENEDNQKLIIKTINDLDNLDNSNNFGDIFNCNNNQGVISFFLFYSFLFDVFFLKNDYTFINSKFKLILKNILIE